MFLLQITDNLTCHNWGDGNYVRGLHHLLPSSILSPHCLIVQSVAYGSGVLTQDSGLNFGPKLNTVYKQIMVFMAIMVTMVIINSIQFIMVNFLDTFFGTYCWYTLRKRLYK